MFQEQVFFFRTKFPVHLIVIILRIVATFDVSFKLSVSSLRSELHYRRNNTFPPVGGVLLRGPPDE
jgi:hypothetical protein